MAVCRGTPGSQRGPAASSLPAPSPQALESQSFVKEALDRTPPIAEEGWLTPTGIGKIYTAPVGSSIMFNAQARAAAYPHKNGCYRTMGGMAHGPGTPAQTSSYKELWNAPFNL